MISKTFDQVFYKNMHITFCRHKNVKYKWINNLMLYSAVKLLSNVLSMLIIQIKIILLEYMTFTSILGPKDSFGNIYIASYISD